MEKETFDIVPRFIMGTIISRLKESTSDQTSINGEKTSQTTLNLPFSNENIASLSTILLDYIKDKKLSGNFALACSKLDKKYKPVEGSKIVLSYTLKK